jgi:hypothetical protein
VFFIALTTLQIHCILGEIVIENKPQKNHVPMKKLLLLFAIAALPTMTQAQPVCCEITTPFKNAFIEYQRVRDLKVPEPLVSEDTSMVASCIEVNKAALRALESVQTETDFLIAHAMVGIYSKIDFWIEGGFSEKTAAEIEVLNTQSKAFVKMINDNCYFEDAQTFAAGEFQSFKMTYGVDANKSSKVILRKKLNEYTPSQFYWLSQFYLYSYDSFVYDQEESEAVRVALEKCLCEYSQELANMMQW